MPSSSLVEVEVEGVRVGVGLTFSVGWVGGWLECWRVKLISSQVVVEVEVGVELGKISNIRSTLDSSVLLR